MDVCKSDGAPLLFCHSNSTSRKTVFSLFSPCYSNQPSWILLFCSCWFFFLFLLSDIHHSFNRVLIQWATLFAFHFHCLYFSILSLLLNAINPAARLINQMLALSWLFFLNICFPLFLYSFAIFAMYIEQYLSIHDDVDWKKEKKCNVELPPLEKSCYTKKKQKNTRNDVWKKYRQCGGRSFVRLLWKDKYNCKSDVNNIALRTVGLSNWWSPDR